MDRVDRPAPSPLAIASLVAGLIVCCPIVPQIVAVTLGMMALSRIRAAEAAGRPGIGGRRLAIGRRVLGSVGLLAQAFVTERLGVAVRTAFDRDLRDGVAAVLAARDEPTARAGLAGLSATGSFTPEQVLTFATESRARFGDPDGVSIISQVPAGSPLRQETVSAVVFGFRRDGRRLERTGSVSAEIVTPFGEILPSLRILEISIEEGPDVVRLGRPLAAPADSGENPAAATPPAPAP